MSKFFDQVYEIVEKIPAGRVMTYGDIAKFLGRPRASRFVGFAMSAVCENDNRPWHRVTFSDGRLWDGKWEKVQHDLLAAEGVGFTGDGRIDLEHFRWHPNGILTASVPKDLPLKF